MASQARKVFGAFEKRAPGPKIEPGIGIRFTHNPRLLELVVENGSKRMQKAGLRCSFGFVWNPPGRVPERFSVNRSRSGRNNSITVPFKHRSTDKLPLQRSTAALS